MAVDSYSSPGRAVVPRAWPRVRLHSPQPLLPLSTGAIEPWPRSKPSSLESHIVQVVVTEDDGSEHDYQFDFDPSSGRWEFSERDLLERDFGEEWVEELEERSRA